MLLVADLFVLLLGLCWCDACLYDLLWLLLVCGMSLGLILFVLVYDGLLVLVVRWLLMC